MTEPDPAHNPWTVLSTSTVYSNPWITVEHNEILDPSGRNGIYGVIRYAHLTVATLAINEEGKTCLVGQYRVPHSAYAWELPGGGSDAYEAVQGAAQRELCEETGYEAANWLPLPPLHPSNGTTDEVAFPFLAWALRKADNKTVETDVLKVEWIPFGQVLDRVEAGEIKDATTVATIFRVALMLIKGELPDSLAAPLAQVRRNVMSHSEKFQPHKR